jgi:uncharacterized membrane protein
MALTAPIGGLSFLVMTIAFGELGQLVMFPTAAFVWLASQGVVHFVVGRYCNYRSDQLMGVNLTAPVVQLQVPFAMMLAVMTLHEKYTVLQAIGSALMLGGSFITQGNAGKRKKKAWRRCQWRRPSRPCPRRSRWRRRNRNPNRPFSHACSRAMSSAWPRRCAMAARR